MKFILVLSNDDWIGIILGVIVIILLVGGFIFFVRKTAKKTRIEESNTQDNSFKQKIEENTEEFIEDR